MAEACKVDTVAIWGQEIPAVFTHCQVIPSDPNLGVSSDLEKGVKLTSIWVLLEGQGWKKLVYYYKPGATFCSFHQP